MVFALLVLLVKSEFAIVLMAYGAHLLVSPLAFFLYRTIVFQSTGTVLSSFLRFQAGYALPLMLNGPLLYFGITVLNGEPLVVQGVLTLFFIAMTFLANRYFAFRSPQKTKP